MELVSASRVRSAGVGTASQVSAKIFALAIGRSRTAGMLGRVGLLAAT
jgi:hypothetical protein